MTNTLSPATNTILLKPGFEEFVINTENDMDLHFICKDSSNTFIHVQKAKSLTINLVCEKNANCTFLVWNETNEEVEFNESYTVQENASLELAYGECNQASIKRNSKVILEEENAKAYVSSATLCKEKKEYTIWVESKAPHTSGIMENYSVVLNNGTYRMEATGKIDKGASASTSRQTSRALCFDEHQSSTILPKLLIDENDVIASHATSVGRVDEDQLIYMQSRGLTIKQVMSLVSVGYLMPIVNRIENDELKKTLSEEIERRVSESCTM